MLLESQEFCIIKARIKTSYFNLKKILAKLIQFQRTFYISELSFLLVKTNHKIRGVNIFQYTYLFTVYAGDTTFFLKNKNSISHLMETFSTFFSILGKM